MSHIGGGSEPPSPSPQSITLGSSHATREDSQKQDDNSHTALLHEALEQVALRQYRRALEYFQRYLSVCRADDNPIGIGRAYRNIGSVYLHLKQPLKAIEFLSEGLQYAQAVDDAPAIAKTLMHIGYSYAIQGQFDAAAAFLRDALDKAESAGAHKVAGAAMEHLAEICMRRGHYAAARRLLQGASERASAANDDDGGRIAEANVMENERLWTLYRRALGATHLKGSAGLRRR
jgi:tetratricopeptide (TPR) repeat protein